MATNYTPEMLAALELAIAQGARDVYYGDKRVSYRSLEEMLQIRNVMRAELGMTSNFNRRKFAEHNKGL